MQGLAARALEDNCLASRGLSDQCSPATRPNLMAISPLPNAMAAASEIGQNMVKGLRRCIIVPYTRGPEMAITLLQISKVLLHKSQLKG